MINNIPPTIKDIELIAKLIVCFIGLIPLSRFVISKLLYVEREGLPRFFINNPVGLPPIDDSIEIIISTTPSINRASFKLYPLELTKNIAIINPRTDQITPNNMVFNNVDIESLFIICVVKLLKNNINFFYKIDQYFTTVHPHI